METASLQTAVPILPVPTTPRVNLEISRPTKLLQVCMFDFIYSNAGIIWRTSASIKQIVY